MQPGLDLDVSTPVLVFLYSLFIHSDVIKFANTANFNCKSEVINPNCLLNAALSDPSWSVVVLWHFLASYYFYCTGHQATIPSIRFEAAFIGFPGDIENIVLPG